MITVTNQDGLVKVFPTDELFLEYARAVYKENEDNNPFGPSEIHWLPEDIYHIKEDYKVLKDVSFKTWVKKRKMYS